MSIPRVLISTFAVLLAGSACIDLPEIDSPSPPGSGHGLPDAGHNPDASVPLNLTVTLLAPSEKVFTNDTVAVQVKVMGGEPDKVELLVDDQPLTTLTPPYNYQWNTNLVAEGSHQVTARAVLVDNTFQSETREVVVDRTPPQVVSRSPAPGAQDVWVRHPIEATFSEPLRGSSISDSSVRLATGPNAVARAASLSSDGQRLTVTPSQPPETPSTLTLTLSNELTDLAGNRLAPPSDTWIWHRPSWIPWGAGTGATIPRGGNESLFEYQLDLTGRIIGAWRNTETTLTKLEIKLWENGAWKPLGGTIGIRPQENSITDSSLLLDTLGQPLVAWSEPAGSTARSIHVRRFVNGEWLALGNAIDAYAGQTSAMYPILQLDPSGDPVVAWMESNGTSVHVCLRRWKEDSWQAVGECLDTNTANDVDPLLRFDQSGRAIIAWYTTPGHTYFHIRRLETNGWQDLNSGEEPSDGQERRLSMQVDPSENPITAWTTFDGAADSIFVARWDGSSWIQLGGSLLNATPGSTNVLDHAVQVDVFGNPVIAWTEDFGAGPKVYIRRWVDGSWEPVDGFAGPEEPVYTGGTGAGFGLHRDNSGNLLLTWLSASSPARLQILRQNR